MPRQTPATPRNRGGKTYTVNLANGNTLSVTVNVNPFELSGNDRAFVFDIVDKVTGYGKKNGAKTRPVVDHADQGLYVDESPDAQNLREFAEGDDGA